MAIVVIMGVSGSGKTTVASLLAETLGCPFQEGDALHPPANVEKMRGGTPLSDDDRLPWLHRIATTIEVWRANGGAGGGSGIVTCSALKRVYRDIVLGGRGDAALVYLKGSRELIEQRMAARRDHFMPARLLDSQFRILEEPASEERPIVVDIGAAPAEIVAGIVTRLGKRS